MTSGTELIQFGGCDVSKFVSLRHVVHDLLERSHFLLRQPVDLDAIGYALSYFKVFVGRFYQIIDALIIDFQVANTD